MSRLLCVIFCFSIALPGVVGCNRHTESPAKPGVLIVGRWETMDDPKNGKTVWEFTKDGKVTGSSGPEAASTGTFRFVGDDTMEIAWEGEDMEKATYKVKITSEELEHRVVSINLGDGPRAAKGPTTTMKRAKP